MDFSSIDNILKEFTRLKVLIIGDVMIDSYTWGKVERISPEAPVPVVNVSRREKRLGGAANVAMNIRELGATPILCSVIGDDQEGDEFLHLLKDNALPDQGIIRSKTRMTTNKLRVLSGSQQMMRIDHETDTPLVKLEEQSLIGHIKRLIDKGVDVVIFEDYDKGTINEHVISETVSYAKDKNVPTVVDPKKRNFNFYKNVTLFKPNLKELREGLHVDVQGNNRTQIDEAVKLLKDKLNADSILLTLSEHGIHYNANGRSVYLDAHYRRISDVSGAGDTVVSIAALCLALGLEPDVLAGLANLGGGIVCEYLGVVPVDRDRLREEALKNNIPT
ncbi:bifunctional heptose 7-phosphate kinase/heptose 1-phosphate adenyltransferase [Marinigracilibium pacificum]|uniref:D-glycero-beta-D-manno-heptose-7-phosphate kinase n=1 Tax=Marinigracilibium pacificum TaxID=2729599 RepID=A0A848J005_9BACT|nr:bifunctional ADP-heptose synthase [Marinigracilibium pacificum]NMM48718.1 D-glycero-beta-D-manno-heptose-7-phosphate kinase [Marinigracilibium pacificum]